jgi:hypothetical protein
MYGAQWKLSISVTIATESSRNNRRTRIGLLHRGKSSNVLRIDLRTVPCAWSQ